MLHYRGWEKNFSLVQDKQTREQWFLFCLFSLNNLQKGLSWNECQFQRILRHFSHLTVVSIIGISGTRRAGAVFLRRWEEVGEIVELGELVDFVSGVLGSSSGSSTSIFVSGLNISLFLRIFSLFYLPFGVNNWFFFVIFIKCHSRSFLRGFFGMIRLKTDAVSNASNRLKLIYKIFDINFSAFRKKANPSVGSPLNRTQPMSRLISRDHPAQRRSAQTVITIWIINS